MYFSELAFWAKYDRVGMTPLECLSTWGVYSMLAFIFLAVVHRFRVRSVWALFLAGALYGWLGEGVFVQTMYDDFPINLSWTGLAWHALISVLVGWYLVRKVLLESKYVKTLALSGSIGFLYGFWAIFWWIENNAMTPLGEFSLYVLITTVLLILSYGVYDKIQPFTFKVTQVEIWFTVFIIALYFIFITYQANPFAPIMLFPLLTISFKAGLDVK